MGSRKFDFEPARPVPNPKIRHAEENDVIKHADFSTDRTKTAALHASRSRQRYPRKYYDRLETG